MAAFRGALETTAEIADDTVAGGPFAPTWDSLAGYTVPEWFRDRKFGVYFHWGLYSVPAYRYEWYPKWMYTPDRDGWGQSVHDHHVSTYGPPDRYPYQRFATGFTAERFDAGAWADLFERAGAGFAGPVVEHHDGWSNWASGINPYNAADGGPERDLVGELEAAIRDRGMKFVTTFHHGRAARGDRVNAGDDSDGYYNGAYEHYPSVTEGFPNRVMYRNMDDGDRWDMWLGKLVEVCERYQPDLVWHDSLHVPPDAVKRRYLAYNLNRAAAQGRDVAITYKEVEFGDTVGAETLIRDYENDQADELKERPWLTDTSISNGAWCYTEGQTYRSVRSLVRELVTIVSKNGQLLLNLTPRADGTFPDPMVDRLEGLGDWLEINGEAIYGTRPWKLAREGERVRFTRSKDGETLYAIYFGFPDDSLRLSLVPPPKTEDASVTLIGGRDWDIPFSVDGDAVVLDTSSAPLTSRHAVSFRLEGFTHASG